MVKESVIVAVKKNLTMNDNYYLGDYLHKTRWAAYFYQIKDVKRLNPKSVLIVGKGDGAVEDYLKKLYKVTTLDIDAELEPDVVGDVRAMPFKDKEFDVVLCCHVLEHLPFKYFESSVEELKRVSKTSIIALPDYRRTLIRLILKIPFVPQIKIFIKVHSLKKHKILKPLGHQWIIGRRGYPVAKIKKILGGGVTPIDTPMNFKFTTK